MNEPIVENANKNYPQPTTDLTIAKAHMDEFGYCILANAISPEEATALRTRLLEQAEAEAQRGITTLMEDKKQLVFFLINKGQGFRDLLFHPGLRELVGHVLGSVYLLSSYVGHSAHPGGTKVFHTDQWWMPPPTNGREETLIKPGSITRETHRGHHAGGKATMNLPAMAPACVCNAMWMIDDFREDNGATIVVPGSHLFGRQPDPELDAEANWIPAEAPAGSVMIFEGRTWHSTGANRSDQARIGLTTNFCAPQFRQQENLQLGTSPEVLEEASEELLALIGFKAWYGYGSLKPAQGEWVTRGHYALGELKPG